MKILARTNNQFDYDLDAVDFFEKIRSEEADETNIPDVIETYLKKSLLDIVGVEPTDEEFDIKTDELTIEEAQRIDNLLTVYMVDNNDIYNQYMSDDLSDLLDFLITITEQLQPDCE